MVFFIKETLFAINNFITSIINALSSLTVSHFLHVVANMIKDIITISIPVFFIYYFIKPYLRCKVKIKNTEGFCLLISGAWGSGKTHFYEYCFKNKTKQEDIYISCFSARKFELIQQIANTQWRWRLFSCNGFFEKFLANNWQSFMPINRTIVFDDLERLHSTETNYLDLIGIIEFLKTNRNCNIILIANLEKPMAIFNDYIERIVDEIIEPPKIKLQSLLEAKINNLDGGLNHKVSYIIDKLNTKSKTYSTIQMPYDSPILRQIIISCQYKYDTNRINNLRIIKKILYNQSDSIAKNKYDDKMEQIISIAFTYKLETYINIYHLFFKNNQLYEKIVKQKIENNSRQGIEEELKKYNLKIDDFTKENLLDRHFKFDLNNIAKFTFHNIQQLVVPDGNYTESLFRKYLSDFPRYLYEEYNLLNAVSSTPASNSEYSTEVIKQFEENFANFCFSDYPAELKKINDWHTYLMDQDHLIFKYFIPKYEFIFPEFDTTIVIFMILYRFEKMEEFTNFLERFVNTLDLVQNTIDHYKSSINDSKKRIVYSNIPKNYLLWFVKDEYTHNSMMKSIDAIYDEVTQKMIDKLDKL